MAISPFLQVYPSRRERAGKHSVILESGTAARARCFLSAAITKPEDFCEGKLTAADNFLQQQQKQRNRIRRTGSSAGSR
jgi:hypothetical protein